MNAVGHLPPQCASSRAWCGVGSREGSQGHRSTPRGPKASQAVLAFSSGISGHVRSESRLPGPKLPLPSADCWQAWEAMPSWIWPAWGGTLNPYSTQDPVSQQPPWATAPTAHGGRLAHSLWLSLNLSAPPTTLVACHSPGLWSWVWHLCPRGPWPPGGGRNGLPRGAGSGGPG